MELLSERIARAVFDSDIIPRDDWDEFVKAVEPAIARHLTAQSQPTDLRGLWCEQCATFSDANLVGSDAICPKNHVLVTFSSVPSAPDAAPETSNCCNVPLMLYTADLTPYYVCRRCHHFQRFPAATPDPSPVGDAEIRRICESASVVCWQDSNGRYHVSDEVIARLATQLPASDEPHECPCGTDTDAGGCPNGH